MALTSTSSDNLSTHDAARQLCSLGYHVVPLLWKSKAAVHREWQNLLLNPEDIENYFPPGNFNLGLLLGTEVADGVFTIAFDIDVDDALLIERVRIACGPAVRKRGAKGQTLIARTARTYAKKVWKRKDANGKSRIAVELLGARIQTVLPPSIHPDTGEPYEWLGAPLWDVNPADLPLVGDATIDEIELAIAHPESPLFGLNDMEWHGPGKGGTVDASLLSATGVMVQRGWLDEAIYARCDRAVAICLNRSGNRPEWDDAEYRRRVRSMVDDARKKGFDEAKPKKQPKDRMIAEWLVAECGGIENVWGEEGGFIRIYNDGHWLRPDFQDLGHRIWSQFSDAGESAISGALRIFTRSGRPHGRYSARRICLLNGTYDLMTGEMLPWSRDDLLLSQLPIRLEPEAAAPRYDAFMAQTFAKDDAPEGDVERSIACFEEFLGYTLINDRSFHKMLVIKGRPGTGKSTLLKLIGLLHDRSTMSFVTLSHLSKESYLSHMDGKLVNCTPEVQVLAGVDDQILKQIISGDEVSIRRLYNQPVDAEITARIVVACNEMFRTNDTSGALERRMIILSCDNPVEKPDPNFLATLREELPGIFNKIMLATRNLYRRGYFDPPAYVAGQLREFGEDNNPVALWLQDRTHQGRRVVDPEYDHPLLARDKGTHTIELYADYAEWAKMNGFKQMSSVTWGHKLKSMGYDSKATRLPSGIMRARKLHLIDIGAGKF